jgi:hypothetical protein
MTLSHVGVTLEPSDGGNAIVVRVGDRPDPLLDGVVGESLIATTDPRVALSLAIALLDAVRQVDPALFAEYFEEIPT